MDYEEFKQQVAEQIKDFLPEKYADAKVTISQVIKNNDRILDGLMVNALDSNQSPIVYLNLYYDQLKDGEAFSSLLSEIAQVFTDYLEDRDWSGINITDYDLIKDRIRCKLINLDANVQYLRGKPYTQMEDLAVVYQILLDKNADRLATITITDNLLDSYGITLPELHKQALDNMEALQPVSFKSISETLIELFSLPSYDDEASREQADKMIEKLKSEEALSTYVLTNRERTEGAAEILRDDVRQQIAEKLGDFYVIPSSIHEVLVLPQKGINLKDLEKMVQETNQIQVLPEERLSDHIYSYDAKTHILCRGDKGEERSEQSYQSVKSRLNEKKTEVAAIEHQRHSHKKEQDTAR